MQARPWSIQNFRVASLGLDRVRGSQLGWEKKVGLKSQPRPRERGIVLVFWRKGWYTEYGNTVRNE